jgi:non-ribosomal peptide synthetase component E (peptide arylation enzyme)
VGFFDDPERTAATFDQEGWVRSGDLVTADESGYVTVVGRRKEIIIRGGINIAPREIEELLVGFEEVAQAAVIGLPDERLGERMCACLVLVAGATLDLETAVARLKGMGLATYKLPERLEILESLPTTASGKIQKHELIATLSGQPA